MKPLNAQQEKNKLGEKSEERGEGRKRKVKSRLLSLLSTHAWTSQANILHLDQK